MMFLFRRRKYRVFVAFLIVILAGSFFKVISLFTGNFFATAVLTGIAVYLFITGLKRFFEKVMPFDYDSAEEVVAALTALSIAVFEAILAAGFVLSCLVIPEEYLPAAVLCAALFGGMTCVLHTRISFKALNVRLCGKRNAAFAADFIPEKAKTLTVSFDGDLKDGVLLSEGVRFVKNRARAMREGLLYSFINVSRYAKNKSIVVSVNGQKRKEISLSPFAYKPYVFHKGYSGSWVKIGLSVRGNDEEQIEMKITGKRYFFERLFSNYCAIAALPVSMPGSGEMKRAGRRKNAIVVSLDCVRRDIAEGLIKNYASLAEMRSCPAVSASNWTLPSHVSMLSGLLPTAHGSYLSQTVSDRIPWLPEILREKGCTTCGIVSHNRLMHHYNFNRGFDYFFQKEHEKGLYGADYYLDKALEFLDSEEEDKFLFVHLFDAHAPYIPKWNLKPYDLGYEGTFSFHDRDRAHNENARGDFKKFAAEDVGMFRSFYEESIARLFAQVDNFISCLKSKEWFDDSVIIITADHGELFGEGGLWGHQGDLEKEVLDVPFLIKHSGSFSMKEGLVSGVDILPTVLEHFSIDIPEGIQGRSLFSAPKNGYAVSEGFMSANADFYSAAIRHEDGSNVAQSFEMNIEKILESVTGGKEVLASITRGGSGVQGKAAELEPLRIEIKEKILENRSVLDRFREKDPLKKVDQDDAVVQKRLEELGYM